MSNVAYFFIPAVIGLLAGVGHGITSHYFDLPFSLFEQIISSSSFERSEK